MATSLKIDDRLKKPRPSTRQSTLSLAGPDDTRSDPAVRRARGVPRALPAAWAPDQPQEVRDGLNTCGAADEKGMPEYQESSSPKALERQRLLLETTPDSGPARQARTAPTRTRLWGCWSVALYRYELAEDAVYVLTFRHQKEAC